jgi:hypothetical protein
VAVTIRGSKADEATLRSEEPTGDPGDGWIVYPDLWVWIAEPAPGDWENVGPIAGPIGPTGGVGPTGPTGADAEFPAGGDPGQFLGLDAGGEPDWFDLPSGFYRTSTHAAGTTIGIPASQHGLEASAGLQVQVLDLATSQVEIPDVTVSAAGFVTITYAVAFGANTKMVTVAG